MLKWQRQRLLIIAELVAFYWLAGMVGVSHAQFAAVKSQAQQQQQKKNFIEIDPLGDILKEYHERQEKIKNKKKKKKPKDSSTTADSDAQQQQHRRKKKSDSTKEDLPSPSAFESTKDDAGVNDKENDVFTFIHDPKNKRKVALPLFEPDGWIIEKLQLASPDLTAKSAKELATLIVSIEFKLKTKKDLETEAMYMAQQYVVRYDAAKIIQYLLRGMESLRYVEALFMAVEKFPENEADVFEQMKANKLVPPEKESLFENNLDLLQDHVRNTAYVSIKALSMAGGYTSADKNKNNDQVMNDLLEMHQQKQEKKERKKKEKVKIEVSTTTKPKKDRIKVDSADSASSITKGTVEVEVVDKLKEDAPDLPTQRIHDLAAVIYSAQHNEAQESLRQEAAETAEQFRREAKNNARTIVDRLDGALDSLEKVEEIFRSNIAHDRLLNQMIVVGLVESEDRSRFANDPAQLRQHTVGTAYFIFVAWAIAGGYLK